MIRTSFPPLSTRQSFIDDVWVYDNDDDSLIDLTGCKIQLAIRAQFSPFVYDYGRWSGTSWNWSSGARLLATTDDGSITIPDLGVFIFTFTEQQMAALCPGIYDIACNMARDDETIQFILGQLPILDGVVPL
jgi:hypothetical protein